MNAVEQSRLDRLGSGDAVRFGQDRKDQFKSILRSFDFLPSENPNKDFLINVAFWATERADAFMHLMKEELGAAKLNVATDWLDYCSFNAKVQQPDAEGNAKIFLNLGVLPYLLGISHRLCAIGDGRMNMAKIMFLKHGPSFAWGHREIWDPLRNPTSDVNYIDVRTWATPQTGVLLDALLLLWLHELAHLLGGHHFAKEIKMPHVRRAAEFDADIGAGYLLMTGHLTHGATNKETILESILAQCINAAIVCFICTRVTTEEQSEQYHLPALRMHALMTGMFRAWISIGKPAEAFRRIKNAHTQRSGTIMAALYEIYLDAWEFPNGKAHEDDRLALRTVTLPLLRDLQVELHGRRKGALWDGHF
jgi:hypothetical protein